MSAEGNIWSDEGRHYMSWNTIWLSYKIKAWADSFDFKRFECVCVYFQNFLESEIRGKCHPH
jgi:hypothetical protein